MNVDSKNNRSQPVASALVFLGEVLAVVALVLLFGWVLVQLAAWREQATTAPGSRPPAQAAPASGHHT